ncbi:hypothetical protein [Ideonella sp. BN130291]|uniref:hypothetical protein n=1 Tax=Ideonella sp. BN130291 TaxID=3112940 RepID=UPI002E26633E|nr:hypothetical protein [Ideonella sp. BN130291]
MLPLKLALVAMSVLLASLGARRFGHAVGGTIAGMPMIAGPIMGFVLLQAPAGQARAIALATLVCLPATIVHMLVFAWSATRWRWWAAFVAANAAFVLVGLLLVRLDANAPVVFALALVTPAAGQALMPQLALTASIAHIPRVELACRVVGAVAMAWLIMRSAGVAAAGVSGLLLALPITGNVLPCFTQAQHGPAATVALLRGFVRGLLGFAAFFVALHAGLGALHPGLAYGLAWLAALLTALSLYQLNQRARRRQSAGLPPVA